MKTIETTLEQFKADITPEDVKEWGEAGVDLNTEEGLQEAYDWFMSVLEPPS